MLYSRLHFSLKLPLRLGDLDPRLTRDSLGPNGISIGPAIFARLTSDRPELDMGPFCKIQSSPI